MYRYILLLLTINVAFAQNPTVSGLKYPNFDDEGYEPVLTEASLLTDYDSGFSDLLPYVLPSPNQEDAGSCLYMATTGNIEWWLGKLNPKASREMNGPIDISERYLMNIAGSKEHNEQVKNWRTDTVFLVNPNQSLVKNSDYPFTKGWYKRVDGKKVPAQPHEEGADYGTIYNWIKETSHIQTIPIKVPKFEREILFADPENNQWNVGITPDNIVQKVKDHLVKNKAPVLVMYNHYGYWHVHMIVGFDDEALNNECRFSKGTIPFMAKKADKYQILADEEKDPKKKVELKEKAIRYTKLSHKLEGIFEKIGGCRGKGSFYVRDSLYSPQQGINYNYGNDDPSDDRPYAKNVILREYEYLNVLANHIIQIKPL